MWLITSESTETCSVFISDHGRFKSTILPNLPQSLQSYAQCIAAYGQKRYLKKTKNSNHDEGLGARLC